MPNRVEVDDLVVLIPGILGSVLSRNGAIWKISPDAVLTALTSLGGSLKDLELKTDGHTASPDGIKATELFKDTQIIPFFWKVNGYEKTARELKDWLTLDDDNYFEFPYDWRLDNRVAAKQLAREVEERLAKLKEIRKKDDLKVIFLAHSMGGLVARYFIEKLGGWTDTRMLITFGTPYHGSLQALGFLMNGYPVKVGPIKIFDFSSVMRSFPSVYQLLPTFDCIDVGAGTLETLRKAAPNLSVNNDIKTAELQDAIAFHDEIFNAVKANKNSAGSQVRYEIHPIVGTDQPTYVRAKLNRKSGVDLFRNHPKYPQQGDTTVPWISAHPGDTVPVERSAYFIECHGSLQNSDDCLTQVRNVIAVLRYGSSPIPRAVTPYGISLHIKDLFEADDVVIAAKTKASSPLYADIVDVQTENTVAKAVPLQLGANRRHSAKIDGLKSGVYRVTVSGDRSVRPVTDTFIVLG
jgi:pimeloyl-ACP methyl ester carboxylesterase